ncbi:MAG: heavy metal-binding domain-containing protein [Bacteroidales bacterium]|nr:heavy metal-binding domain-containing protein [Bacteroidales bacterium]
MKKKRLVIIVGLLMMTLSGCGVSRLDTTLQTSVVLSQNNYKIIGSVQGSTQSFYILGIGGLSNETLKENAVNEMMKNAKLKDGQAIININYTTSVANMILYAEKNVTAYGTIIEFIK